MLGAMLLRKKTGATGPGYRYVKLDSLVPANGSSYVSITEFQVIDTGSGANWCRQSGAVATAKSYYTATSPSQTPAQAIDGFTDSNPAHRWSSDGSNGQWFQVDFGQSRIFDSITIATHLASGQQPKSFVIKGSNDGTNWDTLKTVTNQTYPAEYVATEVYKT